MRISDLSSDVCSSDLTWAFVNPLGLQTLMEILIEATGAYLERQIAAGAEVVQLFDTWAGVLPEHEFRRFCIDPVRRIITRLKEKHPQIPVIAFPRGAGALYDGYAQATGDRKSTRLNSSH